MHIKLGELPIYNKDNPYLAHIIQSYPLTKSEDQWVQHITLDITDAKWHYEPGDAIGIFPQNRTEDVLQILKYLRADAKTLLPHPKTQAPTALEHILTHDVSLTHLSRDILNIFYKNSTGEAHQFLTHLLDEAHTEAYKSFIQNKDLIDIFEYFPTCHIPAEALIPSLRRLVPRLYSIASSQKTNLHTIDLIISVPVLFFNHRQRFGVGSYFLAKQPLDRPHTIPCFLTPSHFRIPEDDAAPIIMIGPGTGVAPFRGFLQERISRKATGKNWLFFGERYQATNYFYQKEWEAALQSNILTRIDLAFSRDQSEKIYVQDRLKENATEIWSWLQQGAYIYVCGDATHMAKGVEEALKFIFQTEGKLDEVGAHDYLKHLKKIKRYQRDVY